MKSVYVLSGLGADKRVFQWIDFGEYTPTFIEWVLPTPKESIEAYAQRLMAQIKGENPVVVGISFGGMMACEIAKQMQVQKVVLIASAPTKKQIPLYYRLAGRLSLHTLLPHKWLKKANCVTDWFFGAETQQEKKLLKEILEDTNEAFLKWAIDKIVNWKNQHQPKQWVGIHGTKDRILPFRFAKCDYKVENAGHFMTLNHYVEISEILQKELNFDGFCREHS